MAAAMEIAWLTRRYPLPPAAARKPPPPKNKTPWPLSFIPQRPFRALRGSNWLSHGIAAVTEQAIT